MLLIFEHDVNIVDMNHHMKYRGHRSVHLNIVVQIRHTEA